MVSPQFSDDELERIIADATIDAYDEDEVMSGWETYLEDEMSFPFSVQVLGQKMSATRVALKRNQVKIAVQRTGETWYYWLDFSDVMIVEGSNICIGIYSQITPLFYYAISRYRNKIKSQIQDGYMFQYKSILVALKYQTFFYSDFIKEI
jgi:hypothetical protein